MKKFLAALLTALAVLIGLAGTASAQNPGCNSYSLQVGCYIYPQAVLQVPQILPNGTNISPSLAWSNAPSTGFYLDTGGPGIQATVGGTRVGEIAGAGLIGFPIGRSSPQDGTFTTLGATTVLKLPTWSTVTRPLSPTIGMTGWDTTISAVETWNGSVWTSANVGFGNSRVVTTGLTDTATTADAIITWNSTTSGSPTETVYACNSATIGKTLVVTDGKGNTQTSANAINVVPQAGTIAGTTGWQIDAAYGGVRLTCDGISNWLVTPSLAYGVNVTFGNVQTQLNVPTTVRYANGNARIFMNVGAAVANAFNPTSQINDSVLGGSGIGGQGHGCFNITPWDAGSGIGSGLRMCADTDIATLTGTTVNIATGGVMNITGAPTITATGATITTATILANSNITANGATNGAQLTGSATTLPVTLGATGADTNIGVNISPKGTGTININGHVTTASPAAAPSLSSCVAGTTLTGNDSAGTIVTGSGASTTCSVLFGTNWAPINPVCIGQAQTGGGSSPLASSVVVTTGGMQFNFASTASVTIRYMCVE